MVFEVYSFRPNQSIPKTQHDSSDAYSTEDVDGKDDGHDGDDYDDYDEDLYQIILLPSIIALALQKSLRQDFIPNLI